MPDEPSLPERLRDAARGVGLSTAPELLRKAAREIEEHAGRICELHAELETAHRWKPIAAARAAQLAECSTELERARALAEQAWGPEITADAAAAERAAHPAIILGPGMQVTPGRRVVVIRCLPTRLAGLGSIVRCGPVGATWRLIEADYQGMDADVQTYRVELEPVDAHAVPLDEPVHELPPPQIDLGWVPVASGPPLEEAQR